jgi:hypothetical protein
MNAKLIKRTIEIAKAMCPLNVQHRCSHIAFLIKKGRIHHIGINVGKSHPNTLKYKYAGGEKSNIHAELSVCMKSEHVDLKSYKMIVLRVDRHGNINNSKPCTGCSEVIKQFNVGEVCYSDKNGNINKL